MRKSRIAGNWPLHGLLTEDISPDQQAIHSVMTSGLGKPIKRPLMVGAEWFPSRPGGLNRYFRYLLSSLRSIGVPAEALVLGPADETPDEVTATHDAAAPLFGRLSALRRAALRMAGDVSLIDAHFALYALPLRGTKLARLPLVVHFQGPWADESASQSSGGLRPTVKRAVERNVYRRATQFVVLSSAFKQILVQRYRVPPWKINVIPPGVDLDKFSPGAKTSSRERLGLPTDAWIAMAARRLVPRTGIDVLMEAWADFVRDKNEVAVLLLAGEGPSARGLKRLAEDLGVSTSVRFLGKVSDETLVDCYRAADVSVVPSIELEGFGLVVLESFACGTPVIASAAGGLPEAVGRLGERLLAKPGDTGSLVSALSRAYGKSELPDKDSCRRYAEQFSWNHIAGQNLEIYDKAVRPPAARKRRVVFLDHVARLSGGELALLRLLKAMPEIEAHVILAEDGPLAAKLVAAGISVEVLPMNEAGRALSRTDVDLGSLPLTSVLASVRYVLRLAGWLRKLKPDLVHTNSLKAAIYGGPAAKLAGIPSILHVRDSITTDYLPERAVQLVRATIRRFASGVIANSKSTLATLGPLGCPTSVIPSPLDPSFVEPPVAKRATKSKTPADSKLTVAMVGRIAPWKGQDIFLEAFAEAFVDRDHRAILAGSALFGEEQYRQQLTRLCADIGLNGRVEFAGHVEDVNSFLGDIDILVHASRSPEPFGLAVIEGMAAGLPVVAAAAGGPAEIIDDGTSGLLFPPGNSSALAAALTKLADNPDLRRRLGEAARAEAQRFAPDKIAGRVLDFYARLDTSREPAML